MQLSGNNLYEFAGFTIDLGERTLWRAGVMVPLAPKLAETLCLLVENQGRLMPKEELMDRLWADTFVEERNLTQNIFTLRKVLGETKLGDKFIETVPRRGYRFVAEIRPVEIAEREVIHVTHNKQTRIAAEGFVSTQKLARAVEDIARSISIGNESDTMAPEQIGVQQSKRAFWPTLFVIIAMSSVLAIGGGYWIWQNGLRETDVASFSGNFDPAKLRFERLTESGNAFYPAISPNKEHVAYVLNERGLFSIRLLHVATGSETEILTPKEYELRSPQFSTEGNHLFYGARDGRQETTIYKVPIFGGSSRKIVTNVNHNFTISPDGEWLAFIRYDPGIHGNHLIVCRTDGTEERVVASHRQTTFFRAWGAYQSWSPDGKKIVTSVHRDLGHKAPEERKSYFVEIDVDDGSEKLLNAPHWSVALNAFWLPDGSGFIAQVQNAPDEYYQLWHLSYPDGAARPLTNDINNYTEFRLAPDASYIIASEEKSPHNLQFISTGDTTQIRQLTNSTTIQRGVLGLDWTPDAKEIVYLQLEGLAAGNIWKMNVETLESSQLTFDKGAWNRYPSVTPDGRSIIFGSNRSGKWHIWQMDMDGSNLRQITDGSGENIPRVSPDGKWLAYVTPGEKPNTLWKRPFAGGDPIKVLQDAGGRFDISPDSQQIVSSYYDPDEKDKNPWKYVLLPFDGEGSIEDTGFWSQAAIVRWKPDGTGIYYLSTGQSNTNIWLYSTADKSKRPITSFDSQEIIDLSVSPDGGTIAAARGAKASNLLRVSGLLP